MLQGQHPEWRLMVIEGNQEAVNLHPASLVWDHLQILVMMAGPQHLRQYSTKKEPQIAEMWQE